MGTLTGCLSKIGKTLTAEDAKSLKDAQAEYQGSGMSPQEAALRAIEDFRQTEIEGLRPVVEQITAKGGALPDAIAAVVEPATVAETETVAAQPEAEPREQAQEAEDVAKAAEPEVKSEPLKSARAEQKAETFAGITPDQAINIARDAWGGRLVKKLTDSGILNFVTSEEARKIGVDAPLRATEGDRVAGFYVDGKAYIVADQIKPEEVAGVVLHEVGEHYGMERMLGADLYNRTLKLIERRSGTDPEIRKAWEAAKSAGTADANMAQEALAYLLEQAPGNGIVTRVLDAIKAFLNRLGVPMSRLENEAELLRRVGRESLRMAGRDGAVAIRVRKNGTLYHRAWHGSPHDHDGFKLDKIGTGEGAQAYGWGLYFAGKKEVADYYKNALSRGPEKYYYGDELVFERDTSAAGTADVSDPRVAAVFYAAADGVAKAKRYFRQSGKWGERALAELEKLDPSRIRAEKQAGRLYEVDLAPQEDEYLDWDRPLSEQSAVSRRMVFDNGWQQLLYRVSGSKDAMDFTGAELYRAISKSEGSDQQASEILRAAGIPGIRYLDGTSRGAGDGSRNYVIFDDSLVKITAKYSRRTPQQAQAEAAQNRATLRQQLPAPGQWNWSATAAQRRDGWRGSLTRLREQVQDRMLVFRDARDDIQAQGAVLNEAADVYTRENLAHGRAGEKITRIEREHVNPLIAAMKQAGVKPELLEDYLEAAHAKERNEAIAKINPNMPDGGSGMTTKDAELFLNGQAVGLRSGVMIDPTVRAQLATLADRIKKLTAQTRKTLLDAGIIDKDKYDAMEAAYKDYVPLRDREGVEAGYERIGTTIRRVRDPIKRALGRGDGNRAENLLAEVFADAQRAAILSEKARLDQTLLRMALEHPNPDVWEVEPVKTEQAFSEASGEVYTAVQNIDREPGTVIVPWKGKRYRVLLKDVRMADAYNRLSAENLNGIFRFMGTVNRWFSAVLTRYNPGFVAVNLVRDFQLGLTGVAAEHGMETAAKVAAGYLPAMRAMYRESSGKAPRGRWGNYADEFAREGGKTAFGLSENVEDIQQKIGAEFKTAWKMIRERRPAMAVRKWLSGSTIIKTIEQANDAVENAIRLSTYVALREKGVSTEKAAIYAKNLTVNFNRRGQQTSILNAFYLFFNAAVQGSHRVLKLMKDNPGKMSAVLGALATTQAVSALFAMGMKDDDDRDAWSQVEDWEKQRNLVFVYPKMIEGRRSFGKIKIPMPYGFNVFPYAGGRIAQLAMSMANGEDVKGGKFVNDMSSGLAGAFSPLPLDQQGWRAALPYFANIGLALQTNRDDLGRKITNEPGYPKYEMPRTAYARDDAPEPYVLAARGLNRLGGGDDYTKPMAPALLDWSPDDLEFLVSKFVGGIGTTATKAWKFSEGLLAGIPMNSGDAPLVSSFVSDVNTRQTSAGEYYENRDQIERELAKMRDAARQGGDATEVAEVFASDDVEAKVRKDGGVVLEAESGSLLKAYRTAEKQMDDIRDRMEAVYVDKSLSALERRRQVRALQNERADVQREFNRLLREAKRAGRS